MSNPSDSGSSSVTRRGRIGWREGPLSPPTVVNWVGAGGMALVCLLILLTVLVSAWRALTTWETGTWREATVTAFLLAYGVALMFGCWRVRPRSKLERRFPFLCVPLLAQVGVYLTFSATYALYCLGGHPAPEEVLESALGRVCIGAFLSGVALVVPLHIWARRSLLLVTVEVAGPPLLFLLVVPG